MTIHHNYRHLAVILSFEKWPGYGRSGLFKQRRLCKICWTRLVRISADVVSSSFTTAESAGTGLSETSLADCKNRPMLMKYDKHDKLCCGSGNGVPESIRRVEVNGEK